MDQHVAPHFLDLPQPALLRIVEALAVEDKRSLAVTCTALRSIVASQWRTVVLDESNTSIPPLGIANFTGLRTVIWAQHREDAANLLEDGWEEDDSYDQAIPESHTLTPVQLVRVGVMCALVAEAVGKASGLPTQRALLQEERRRRRGDLPLKFVVGGPGLLIRASPALFLLGNDVDVEMLATGAAAGADKVASIPHAFTHIDAGWFIPDGYLADAVVRASVMVDADTEQGEICLQAYHRLEELRVQGEFIIVACVYSAHMSRGYTAFPPPFFDLFFYCSLYQVCTPCMSSLQYKLHSVFSPKNSTKKSHLQLATSTSTSTPTCTAQCS